MTMRQVHKAGEKCFVDYSGVRPSYTDPQTGEQVDVELFVAVLGASNYTYAEATATQQVPDFVSSHDRAFEYFGGVTEIVVPDQLVDLTSRRVQTYVESGAVHAPFADPYCLRLSAAVLAAEPSAKSGGTMVVIEGPRFSTRAESQSYAAQGWSLVNMTGHPEAVLARELAMCYAAIALVTDMDAGVESGQGVGQAEVFAMFAANLERLKGLLARVLGDLPSPDGCACSSWAEGLDLTYDVPG